MDQPEHFLLSQCTSLGLHPGVHLVQRGLDKFIQRVGHDVGDGVVENTGDDSDEDVGHPVKQNVATESDVHVAARGCKREKKIKNKEHTLNKVCKNKRRIHYLMKSALVSTLCQGYPGRWQTAREMRLRIKGAEKTRENAEIQKKTPILPSDTLLWRALIKWYEISLLVQTVGVGSLLSWKWKLSGKRAKKTFIITLFSSVPALPSNFSRLTAGWFHIASLEYSAKLLCVQAHTHTHTYMTIHVVRSVSCLSGIKSRPTHSGLTDFF